MRLYKFRSVATCTDAERAEDILKAGEFWCSPYWELNDPMEGVYSPASSVSDKFARKLFDTKCGYVLCSFSGEGALSDPLMWGYYANGFKGIAIEIEVSCDDPKFQAVRYEERLPDVTEDDFDPVAVRRVLTTKLNCWRHECEYRYLVKGSLGLQRVGSISAVYFGKPYHTKINADAAERRSRVRDYIRRSDALRKIAANQGIPCWDVDIVAGRVQMVNERRRNDSQ